LGSNLDDRQAKIGQALRSLRDHPRLKVVRCSSLYESRPVGVPDQPLFLNAVAEISTDLSPRALLDVLESIQRSLGRRRSFRWGPRCIDLDLLLYDDRFVDQPGLIVPHPEMIHRAFVLVPLAQIAPQAVHPTSGRTIAQLLASLGDTAGVWLYRPKGDCGSD